MVKPPIIDVAGPKSTFLFLYFTDCELCTWAAQVLLAFSSNNRCTHDYNGFSLGSNMQWKKSISSDEVCI
ncbi:hypothetical protein V6N13_077078 [Hibiscus sabdariffa]|uniref:Uncharacterized protein n=1 Tax=Hibiscus sabdariffa TaxID=183260 RepID=A0ABR2CMT2_9ROSI